MISIIITVLIICYLMEAKMYIVKGSFNTALFRINPTLSYNLSFSALL